MTRARNVKLNWRNTMAAKSIKCYREDELEDYLRFAELKRDITVRLHILNKMSEFRLQMMKELDAQCKAIARLKEKTGLKLDADLRKEINKRLDLGFRV